MLETSFSQSVQMAQIVLFSKGENSSANEASPAQVSEMGWIKSLEREITHLWMETELGETGYTLADTREDVKKVPEDLQCC